MLKKIIIPLFFSILSALLFYHYNHIDIGQCTIQTDNQKSKSINLPFSQNQPKTKNIIYTCNLHSNTNQEALFGIKVDDEITDITLNENTFDLNIIKDTYNQKRLKDWNTGYPLSLDLHKGDNLLIIKAKDYGGSYILHLANDLSNLEFLILFISVITPLFYLLYLVFFMGLSLYKKRLQSQNKISFIWIPLLIILLGVLLRLHLVSSVPNDMYQHDYWGHKAAILHYAEHPFEMPQADKSLQFPQQPLYYLIGGGIHNVVQALGFPQEDSFFNIRILSVILSFIALIIGLKLVQLYSNNKVTITLFIAFLALTPSFVFMGARVNNDILNMVLGLGSVYLISLYYLKPLFKYFVMIILLIVFSMLAKVSSILFALWMVIIMFMHYYKYQNIPRIHNKLQERFFWIGIVVVFFLGFSMLKVYLPTTGEFRFINSALFSGQVLPELDLSYFATFHWFDLIREAQSYSFGSDDVRHSFFTYQYGTMLTGEYIYSKYFESGGLFKLSAQIIYIFGIIYVFGLALYLYYFKHLSTMYKLLLIPVIINLLLIVKLLTDYWNVCNTDFRYYSPVFGAIGLIFVLGLEQLYQKYVKSEKIIIIIATAFFTLQVFWILKLIAMS